MLWRKLTGSLLKIFLNKSLKKVKLLKAEGWEGSAWLGVGSREERREWWLGAKGEGGEHGQGFLEGEQRVGLMGKRVLAKSHAEGSRQGADLCISRLLHQVADRDKKGYPSPSENPRLNSKLA